MFLPLSSKNLSILSPQAETGLLIVNRVQQPPLLRYASPSPVHVVMFTPALPLPSRHVTPRQMKSTFLSVPFPSRAASLY